MTLYYVPVYSISTSANEHTEEYRNGTTGSNITGGTISGQTDEGYQIYRVTIPAGYFTEIVEDTEIIYYYKKVEAPPEEPDEPEVPEKPDNPEKPDEPEKPIVPEEIHEEDSKKRMDDKFKPF